MNVEKMNMPLQPSSPMPDTRHLNHQSPNRPSFHVLFANVTADVGGAEQVILSLAERLPAHGVSVSFALFRPGPLEGILRSRGIKVHVFPSAYRFRDLASVWRCAKWLAGCIQVDGADILHSNLTAHLIGGWAARLARVPELWHLHDYPFKFDPVHSINRLIPADYYLFTTEFLKSGEPRLARRRNTVIHPDCIASNSASKLELIS
jgi:glycosyltransferase involved in cell wall biosynthesis